MLGRIVPLSDYARKVTASEDDQVECFVADVPTYQRMGQRRVNLPFRSLTRGSGGMLGGRVEDRI